MFYTLEMIPVSSSFIRAIGYDNSTLYVEMDTGQTYEHYQVPYDLFVAFINASSKGAFYNKYIRGKFR